LFSPPLVEVLKVPSEIANPFGSKLVGVKGQGNDRGRKNMKIKG